LSHERHAEAADRERGREGHCCGVAIVENAKRLNEEGRPVRFRVFGTAVMDGVVYGTRDGLRPIGSLARAER
jgi:hypothetical protein